MANKPDVPRDFSLTELEADSQTTTEEIDTVESESASVAAPNRDKASTATDDPGAFLLRDGFKSQGRAK